MNHMQKGDGSQLERELQSLRGCRPNWFGSDGIPYAADARVWGVVLWCFQKSSNQPLSQAQRTVSRWQAPLRLQSIPECLSRCPTTVLQPASTTPEPMK